MELTEIKARLAVAIEEIRKADDLPELEKLKSSWLGREGELTAWLRRLGSVSAEMRPILGPLINEAKDNFLSAWRARVRELEREKLRVELAEETVDVTLPSRGEVPGSLHPVTKMLLLLEDFFEKLGFVVFDGPEIEDDFHNFTALNVPPGHPARTMQDTFYFADGTLLRSQTSTVQIRALETLTPPLRIVCPGRVFRRDSDATHAPMFHQMEALMVDRKVNFANLKWIVLRFVKYLFGEDAVCRFRPSYFPFTEPSAEFDLKWKGDKGERWLEIGGCGMVHPEVLRSVGVDPEVYRGFALAFGIDRLAMIRYQIEDIRALFANEKSFLQQFSAW